MDELEQLTVTTDKILAHLAMRVHGHPKSNVVKDYIASCRCFCGFGSIPDYPDWLDSLRRQANGIRSMKELRGVRDVVHDLTSLIESVAYGATEEEHTQESERILRLIKR